MEKENFKTVLDMITQTKEKPEINGLIRDYLERHPNEINKKTKRGFTLLLSAVINVKQGSSEETIKLLLDMGANPNSVAESSRSILAYACKFYGKCITENTIKLLLESGANPNIQDINGNTALSTLILVLIEKNLSGDLHVLKSLIKYGANPNTRNIHGMTELMYLMLYSKSTIVLEIIEILIHAGADPYIKNDIGNYLFDYSDLDPDIDIKKDHIRKCMLAKKTKDLFSQNVLQDIKLSVSEFKLAYGKYGQKIVTYNLALSSLTTDKKELYIQILEKDPDLLSYLGIRNAEELTKLSEYIDYL